MQAQNNPSLALTDLLRDFSPWINQNSPSYPLNRYTLHRNIAGYAFSEKISSQEAFDVCKKLTNTLSILFPSGQFFSSKEMDDTLHHLIFEHLYLANYEKIHPEGGVFIDLASNTVALIHLEDHLTIFFHETIKNSEEMLKQITYIDEQLQKTIPFAYCDLFGYLTTSAFYLGTALSKEAILHTPALNLLGLKVADHSKVLIHGLNAEKEVLNNLIIITNKYCLGVSEKNTATMVDEVADKIIEMEAEALKTLINTPQKIFANDLSKKFGHAFFSKELDLNEALNIASAIDLAISLNLIKTEKKTFYFDLFFSLRRAHLDTYFGDKTLSINEKRAKFFKEKISDIKLNF